MKIRKNVFLMILLIGILWGMTTVDVFFAAQDSGVDGEIQWTIDSGTLTLSAVEGTEGKMRKVKHGV